MSAATTAPAGARVPAAVLAAPPAGFASAAVQKALDCANALSQLAEENDALRELARRQADEIEGLKRHIVSMGRAE